MTTLLAFLKFALKLTGTGVRGILGSLAQPPATAESNLVSVTVTTHPPVTVERTAKEMERDKESVTSKPVQVRYSLSLLKAFRWPNIARHL